MSSLVDMWNKALNSIGIAGREEVTSAVAINRGSGFQYKEAVYDHYTRDDMSCTGVSNIRRIKVGSHTDGILSHFSLKLVDPYDSETALGLLGSINETFDMVTCDVRHSISGSSYRKRVYRYSYLVPSEVHHNNLSTVVFKRLFFRHRETGVWFLATSDEGWGGVDFGLNIKQYDIEEDIVPGRFSGTLPEIGASSLEEYFKVAKAHRDFSDAVEDYEDVHLATERLEADRRREEKEQEEKRETAKEAISIFLANLLVDRNLSINHEVTKEDIVKLVKTGLLELEDLNLSSLSPEDMVNEIAARIPEDQQEAFIERTKELLNAST